MKNILCIGAGYVGGPTMAIIARHCPEYRVTVVDINAERIGAWQSGTMPIFEPGLQEVVEQVRDRNLFFSTDIDGSIEAADIIFVSVNTPTKTFGHGAGACADLRYWEKTARQILARAKTDKIVVEKSTLPVRTAEAMQRILASGPGEVQFQVLSNPEFLAEGTAIADLEKPDRVLIGGGSSPAEQAATRALVEIYAHWVPRERILTTNVWSSEMSKLAANALLAQRISSVNSLSALCEATDADIDEVARAVGMDRRIGSHFLRAGVGFGGSCFQKDILNLVYLCEHYGLTQVAEYWRHVVAINDYQQHRFVQRMLDNMFNTLADKRVAVLGFAFKAHTSDTRHSPAIRICRELVAEYAEVVVSDPQALRNAAVDLADLGEAVQLEPDPYAAAAGAHAVLVLTDWPEYLDLDYARIHAGMVQPAFLFDGRNFLPHADLAQIGFSVYPVGKPPLTPP